MRRAGAKLPPRPRPRVREAVAASPRRGMVFPPLRDARSIPGATLVFAADGGDAAERGAGSARGAADERTLLPP